MMTQSMLQPPVTFVTKPPVIDGILTPEKARLPARRSAHTFKMDPGSPDLDLSDRLGYGTGFLYLYIQVDAETFVCRDRGLQNGDGFVLTLAKPQPETRPRPSSTCSASGRKMRSGSPLLGCCGGARAISHSHRYRLTPSLVLRLTGGSRL